MVFCIPLEGLLTLLRFACKGLRDTYPVDSVNHKMLLASLIICACTPLFLLPVAFLRDNEDAQSYVALIAGIVSAVSLLVGVSSFVSGRCAKKVGQQCSKHRLLCDSLKNDKVNPVVGLGN